MGNTYDSATEAEADRAQQRELLTALGAWDRALRRDECGAWAIIGSRGTIHTIGDGQTWLVFIACRSRVHWTYTKRRLAFCMLCQDGDDEGTLRLHRLPTDAEATLIREVLGVRKRMEFAAEDLVRRRASMTKLGAGKMSASTATRVHSRASADFRAGLAQMTRERGKRRLVGRLRSARGGGAVDDPVA
jgi:hypothetical protein